MINSYDIETYVDDKTFKHVAYCVCLYYKNNFKSFYYDNNESDIILNSLEYIFSNTKKNEKNMIFIHNINYDGLLILNSITKYNIYKFNCLISDLNIYYLVIFYNDKIVEFRCSYKLLPMGLNKIAVSFNLRPKLSFPYEFAVKSNLFYIGKPPIEYFESSKCLNNVSYFNFKKYAISYCKRDVYITREFILIIYRLLESFNISFVDTYSAPSLAFKIFRRVFNKNKITTKVFENLDTILRPSYYGGRCEIFGNVDRNEFAFHYDFSGMYGQCMKEKFCYGDYDIISENDCRLNLNTPGFYSIEYTSNDFDIPVLPHRNIYNGKLMFCNGTMRGVYWYEEILLFIEQGGIVNKIFYGVIYRNYDYVFSEYVDFFTSMRDKGGAYKIFGKLMINSLYGRFGMNIKDEYSFFASSDELSIIEKNVSIISVKNLNNACLIKCRINSWLVKNYGVKSQKNYSNVAIAAAITAKSRVKLFRAFRDVVDNNGRILYCDTDSVFAAYKRGVLNEKHGVIYWDGLKADTVVRDAVFIAPKSYGVVNSEGETVKIKGMPQNSIKFENLKSGFYSGAKKIVCNVKHITKSSGVLESNSIDKTIEFDSYDKRKFNVSRKRTAAYIYREYDYI